MLRSLLGTKKTPLNHEQAFTIAIAQRCGGNIFSRLPPEITHRICTTANPNPLLQKALHHSLFGELAALKAILEEAKREESKETLKLLLISLETAKTPGDLTVENTNLLVSAILGGDPEMVAMIKPYFSEFPGGQEEMERQIARCRPCIDAMMTQQAEDLTWLFDIIKAASAQDVAEELKTGDQYDKTYQSPLRNALNQWRQAKLLPANRVIDVLRAPRMLCNYQNWIHVNAFLNTEWDKNQWADLELNENNYDKVCLIFRQLRGFLELIELPVCERFALANNQVENPPAQITRSLKYKNDDGSFPHFDLSCFESHSGLGFDFYVSIFGLRMLAEVGGGMDVAFQNLCQTKTSNLQNLCGGHNSAQLQPRAGV